MPLRSGDFLVERNGRLVLRDSQAELHLDHLLAAAATRSLSTLPGGFLNVSDAGRGQLLTVLPAHRYAAVGAGPLAALLKIIDPEARPKSRSLLLSRLFGLTPAENRVVMLLHEGLDPNAMAAPTHTTPGIVGFQLKAVYRKLCVARSDGSGGAVAYPRWARPRGSQNKPALLHLGDAGFFDRA